MYFPVKKTGQSSKLASFWKGPFQVNGKLSDILLKINCGRNGTIQTVHIDRVRKIRKQILLRETEALDLSDPEQAQAELVDAQPEPSDAQIEQIELSENADNDEPFIETRHKRVIRKPRWMGAYLSVFSIFREMPNTKQTKRKQATCPNCRKDVQLEKFMDHVKECRKTSTEEPKIIQCDVCFRPFSKISYMRKHKTKFHPVTETVTSAVSDAPPAISKRDTQLSEDWDHDPEVMLDYSDTGSFRPSKSVESDKDKSSDDDEVIEKIENEALTLGRIKRKPCEPQPVMAPIKKKIGGIDQATTVMKSKLQQTDSGPGDQELRKIKVTTIETQDKKTQVSAAMTLRCEYCQISFDDEIIYSIHRGWHNHRDPYQCNMCGEICQTKYGFYSHLGRFHSV